MILAFALEAVGTIITIIVIYLPRLCYLFLNTVVEKFFFFP